MLILKLPVGEIVHLGERCAGSDAVRELGKFSVVQKTGGVLEIRFELDHRVQVERDTARRRRERAAQPTPERENALERVRRERYDEEANVFLLLYEAGKFVRTHDSKLGGRMTRGEAEQHGRRWMGRKSERGYVLDAQPGPDLREAEKSHETGGINDGGSESTSR